MPDRHFAFLVLETLLAALLLAPCVSKTGARWLFPPTTIAGVCLVCAGSGRGCAIGFLLLCLAVAIAISLRFRLRTSRRVLCIVIAASIVIGLTSVLRVVPVTPGEAMAARYPLVSVSERLRYEASHRPASPLDLDVDVRGRMADQDATTGAWNAREVILQRLHSHARDWFSEAGGFGITRMGDLRPDKLMLPSKLSRSPEARLETASYAPRVDATDIPALSMLAVKHKAARDSFLLPAAFGYIRDRNHVAGFEAHAFRRPLHSSSEAPRGNFPWIMTSLQLVSLLRFATPKAYETDEFPDMARLPGVPTRALSEFEKSALPRLVTRQDVVIEEQPNRIHMLGSLRASKACLPCHEVSEGTLLGAFSYAFSRIPARNDVVKSASELQ